MMNPVKEQENYLNFVLFCPPVFLVRPLNTGIYKVLVWNNQYECADVYFYVYKNDI